MEHEKGGRANVEIREPVRVMKWEHPFDVKRVVGER